MMNPRIRALLLFFLAITFGVLLFSGYLIKKEKPPIPAMVTSEKGEQLFTRDDVKNGQKLYLSRCGQNRGSIWGHGSYLAPDWSADFLHRMGPFVGKEPRGQSGLSIGLFVAVVIVVLGSLAGTWLSALYGHFHGDHRSRRRVLCPRGHSPGASWLRDRPERTNAERGRHRLRVQVAAVLFHRGRLLERPWRGRLRVPDQPAHRSLLRPGHQHHALARTHGTVRCLRAVRHRADALLGAPYRCHPLVV